MSKAITSRATRSKAIRLIVLAAAFFLLATSVQASFFTVTLKNGTSFSTRYRPVVAEWDPNVSMIMTDKGNWIALANNEIADVVSVFEESGFGYQPNTTTRYVGWSPNDLVEDQVDEEGNVTENSRYDMEADQGGTTGTYSINDFLLPSASPTSVGGALPIIYGGGDNEE